MLAERLRLRKLGFTTVAMSFTRWLAFPAFGMSNVFSQLMSTRTNIYLAEGLFSP
jgi:hypothetical protein